MPDMTKLNALRKRMNDVEHQDIEKEFLGLFYGDKGVGKSTAAMALAQKLRGNGRILFIDSAEGFASLDNPKMRSLKVSTDRIRVDDPTDLKVLSRAMRTRAKGFEEYTVVVLDEYSSWWTDTLHGFAYEQAGLNPDTDELPVIDWTWYGPPQQAMLSVIKDFHKTVGLHVILVAHEQGRALKGEKNGPDRITPLLGTKLSASIGQLAHIVARFEARKLRDEYVREAQAQPTRYVDAKTRVPGMPLKLSVVDLVKMTSAWVLGGGTVEAATTPEDSTVQETPDESDEDFEVQDDPDEG